MLKEQLNFLFLRSANRIDNDSYSYAAAWVSFCETKASHFIDENRTALWGTTSTNLQRRVLLLQKRGFLKSLDNLFNISCLLWIATFVRFALARLRNALLSP